MRRQAAHVLERMSEIFDLQAETLPEAGAVSGIVCAFALLVDALEANGSLRPGQFEGILTSILRQTGGAAADTAVLQQILSLLQAPELPSLTVISGGKN